MPESESIRAEARRRGISFAKVKGERLYQAKGATYRQEREERFRAQRIRNIRESPLAERPEWVQAELPSPGEPPAPATSDPHGLQDPFGPSPTPAWDYYWPTRTINAQRPRTLQARYSANQRRLEIIFRKGSPASPDASWHYDEVPPGIWTRFKRVESPGRYINAVLNGYPYGPGGWGSIQPNDGGSGSNGE